jgi:hypothetical protein
MPVSSTFLQKTPQKLFREINVELDFDSLSQGCGSLSAWIRISLSCWIRIRIQESKVTHKNRKKNFHVLKCFMFSFEGERLLCSLGLLWDT